MSPATFNAIANTADIDFDKFTLADAIGYAEFEEQCHNWEDVVEE